MPVDPQIATILPLLAGAPPLSSVSAQAARASFRMFTVDMRDPSHLAPVASVEDVTFAGVDGPRPARVYRPDVQGPVPTVLFLHGGGFVIGDLDTHDDHARLICDRVGAVVYSVDYPLAPESPFPAGHLDCVRALQHVVDSIADLGGDLTRLAVAGDSAGGNLSAGVAIAARELGIELAAQLLLYPCVDFDPEADYPSRVDNAEGYFLTSADMLWFGEQYAPDVNDPRGSVVGADLAGVAPAIVATAEFDPLRDEGEAFAALLEKAGVPVVLKRYDGMIHGFFGLGHLSPGAAAAADEICAELKTLLG